MSYDLSMTSSLGWREESNKQNFIPEGVSNEREKVSTMPPHCYKTTTNNSS